MLTKHFTRTKPTKAGTWIRRVHGKRAPLALRKLRIPPAWTGVKVDPDPGATVLAIGYDKKGRLQRLYSPDHVARAKDSKFERIRQLLSEWDDIWEQISSDESEAALVARLIYLTGIRPGSNADTLAEVKAYGATTLQLRHIKPCVDGVRLKYIGKKGVRQNVKVTDPVLVEVLLDRKAATPCWGTPIFRCGLGKLQAYFNTLGSGIYSPKDFRTACGTKLALELLGNRKRLPQAISRRKKIVNRALDRVAKKLGNTRAVSRGSYVDPQVLERWFVERNK